MTGVQLKSLRKSRKTRLKTCRWCKELFSPWSTTQVVCIKHGCASSYAREVESKKAKRAAIVDKRERRVKRQGLKTLTNLCAEAQVHVNNYVRARDRYKGCISCETGAVNDAGHFFPIGSKYRTNRLRFDTRQLFGQCRSCNGYHGGNVHGYTAGLVKLYGEEYVQMLYDLKFAADNGHLPKLTKDEVRAIGAAHRKMVREMSEAS